jgi:hypothetical protein
MIDIVDFRAKRAALESNKDRGQIAAEDRAYNIAAEELFDSIAGMREYFASGVPILFPEEVVALRCKLGEKIFGGKYAQDALRIIEIARAALEDDDEGRAA